MDDQTKQLPVRSRRMKDGGRWNRRDVNPHGVTAENGICVGNG
jgi:hypothetical protein